jgi:hypothetical protein
LGEIGKTGFVGEQDRIHATFLQGVQVCSRRLDNPAQAALWVITGVTGQRFEMTHSDDGFEGMEQVKQPIHRCDPSAIVEGDWLIITHSSLSHTNFIAFLPGLPMIEGGCLADAAP